MSDQQESAGSAETCSYRPLASQRLTLTVFVFMAVVVLGAIVGFLVKGLGASGQAGRYANGSVVLAVLWLVGAYLYLVRIAYRLDLVEDRAIVWRSVLRGGRLELRDVQEIRRGFRFTVIKTSQRNLQVWTGRGLPSFAESVRKRAPDVVIDLGGR